MTHNEKLTKQREARERALRIKAARAWIFTYSDLSQHMKKWNKMHSNLPTRAEVRG